MLALEKLADKLADKLAGRLSMRSGSEAAGILLGATMLAVLATATSAMAQRSAGENQLDHHLAQQQQQQQQQPAGQLASIWDGVYTAAQARRGQAVYPGPCGTCHGRKLNGAPDDPDMLSTRPLAGAVFLRGWDQKSLATLFEYTRATMPENNPSYLSDQEYVDIIAYMLSISGAPTGNRELRSEPHELSAIVIRQQP
jgi:mono/diheme cytochrome c family protein